MRNVLKIDTAHPETAFSRCKEIIRTGGVVVYPTDTFYGLGADPKNPRAIQKLFEIKGRQSDQPVLLLIQNVAEVKNWASEILPQGEQLMKKFWPGPLTLVFKAKQGVLSELTAGTGTIGLRMPGNALTLQFLSYLDTALTGTSANRSGGQSLETAEAACEALGNRVDLILDGGKTPGGKPSTIVDVTGKELRVIREGAVPAKALYEQVKAL